MKPLMDQDKQIFTRANGKGVLMGLIREKREPHMSLRKFAKILGISPSYLSDIELGKRPINKKMVVRIC